MDEDTHIYDMFLELMAKLAADDPEGRMRILSINPRYTEDREQATHKNTTYKRY